MRDNVLTAVVRLAMCPGAPTKGDVCDVCPYAQYRNCVSKMRNDNFPTAKQFLQGATPDAEVQKSMKLKVSEILHDLGTPAHIMGYRYVRSAVMYAVEHPESINAITKDLYPAIAAKYDSTASRVERAIRHAIEVTWDRGDLDVLQRYFGHTVSSVKGKPTNSEFIALIMDRLAQE